MKLINLGLVLMLSTCCTCLELNKCSIYDEKCQLDFFQSIGRDLAFTGIPELGIPIIDPFQVTNVETSILGLLNLTLVDGKAVGIQKCLVTQYITNVPERYKEPEMTCGKIVIRGRYKLTSSPLVQQVFGDVHGDGILQITLDNWYFKFRYPFRFVKKGAEDKIYVKAMFDKAIYETRVDKVVVETCGVKMGAFDISNAVTTIINDNWQLAMASSIGKFINDQSAQFYYDIYGIFFDSVSADKYLIEDFSALAEEDKSKHRHAKKQDL